MKHHSSKRLAILFVVLMVAMGLCAPMALAAKQPKTAEELGYLPPEELLAEDKKTVKFNDPTVQKALEQQWPQLMEADGSFRKDSLKKVDSLSVGIDVIDGDYGVLHSVIASAERGEGFTAEVESVDLSVLQFCTQLNGLSIVAQKVDSLNALTLSKGKNKRIDFIGVKSLNLEACSSITELEVLLILACQVESYEPLTKCKKLGYLFLEGESLVDIGFLAEIPKLSQLGLTNTPNVNIASLPEGMRVQTLNVDMRGAGAEDPRWQLIPRCDARLVIENCTELTAEVVEKYLADRSSFAFNYTEVPTEAVDFSALRGVKNLRGLDLYRANIVDLSFLTEQPNLIFCNMYQTKVQNISGLFAAAGIRNILIRECDIENWGTFAEPIKAENLSQIRILDSGLSDLSFVRGLSLESLWLNGNEIMDISPLTEAAKIEKLSLSDNPVADFSPLGEINGLKLLQHNSAETLPKLKKVKVVVGNNMVPQ